MSRTKVIRSTVGVFAAAAVQQPAALTGGDERQRRAQDDISVETEVRAICHDG